jgi:hypothetical protein
MKAGWWFVVTSWRYLGCDRGTGRWAARLRYFRGLIPKTIWFIRQDRIDRRQMA